MITVSDGGSPIYTYIHVYTYMHIYVWEVRLYTFLINLLLQAKASERITHGHIFMFVGKWFATQLPKHMRLLLRHFCTIRSRHSTDMFALLCIQVMPRICEPCEYLWNASRNNKSADASTWSSLPRNCSMFMTQYLGGKIHTNRHASLVANNGTQYAATSFQTEEFAPAPLYGARPPSFPTRYGGDQPGQASGTIVQSFVPPTSLHGTG